MALFKNKERFLGIDISPSAIKLVELSRSGQRYQVEGFAIEPLREGATENRNPADIDQISQALKRAAKVAGTRLKTVAVAVPTSTVITRNISMPAEYGEDEIEANIQLDAAQYIPFPLEEIYLDFQVQPGKESDQDVMIVASRRENVDLREEVLREAGLKVAIVDVEAYALENTFRLLRGGQSDTGNDKLSLNKGAANSRSAVVDIGASITTLYVFQGDRVIFTREQAFGCDQLTQSIADTYDLPKEKAEIAKRSGDLADDYGASVLTPFLHLVAEQIGNALQFFFSSSHYNSIDDIVLFGGGGTLPGLDRLVADLTGTPVVVGNPFENMSCAKRVNRQSLMRDGPIFGVACGLALRSFD